MSFQFEHKTRGPRTSKAQYEVYVQFLEDHRNFAIGVLTESYDNHAQSRDWELLVTLLNSAPGAVKNPKQWKESLHDWRLKVNSRYRHQNGKVLSVEQANKIQQLSELDMRALKACGQWGNSSFSRSEDGDKSSMHYEEESGDDDEDSHQSSQHESSTYFEITPKRESLADPTLLLEHHQESSSFHTHHAKKRKATDDGERREAINSKAIDDNTRALRQHTAAIMTLSDSVAALTSTIRTYIYSKNYSD